jgi:hypothetical protein
VVTSAGPRVLRKEERRVVSPRLVDVSCEVGDGLCWDTLCLVQWVGVRHAVGPSGVGECPGTETREGRPCARGPVVSCWWMPSSDERSPCGMGSAGFLEMSCCRKASRVPDRGETVISR